MGKQLNFSKILPVEPLSGFQESDTARIFNFQDFPLPKYPLSLLEQPPVNSPSTAQRPTTHPTATSLWTFNPFPHAVISTHLSVNAVRVGWTSPGSGSNPSRTTHCTRRPWLPVTECRWNTSLLTVTGGFITSLVRGWSSRTSPVSVSVSALWWLNYLTHRWEIETFCCKMIQIN